MTETNSQNYDVTSRANTATTKADLNTENPFTSYRREQQTAQRCRREPKLKIKSGGYLEIYFV